MGGSNVECWALVPVKERVACKTRLASTLSMRRRLDLVRTLLRHVIRVLLETPAIDHIGLVSPERDAMFQRTSCFLQMRDKALPCCRG